MRSFRQSLAAAALLAALAPAAQAYDFFTPVSQSQTGEVFYCTIVNVGSTPAAVSASARSMVDGSDLNVSGNCPKAPATLAPGTACFSYSSQSGAQSAYCHFTSTSSKVRADLIIFGTNGGVLDTMPATR